MANLLVPNNSPATWISNPLVKTEATPINGGVLNNQLFSNNFQQQHQQAQPTLAELNSDSIKMEAVDLDFDDSIGNYFMKNNSPNVTLGVGPKGMTQSKMQTSNSANFPTTFWHETGSNWSSLSSSVPGPSSTATAAQVQPGSSTYNISPLSDILTDLSSNSGSTPTQSLSPNLPSHSPSQAGKP